jgi:hypothetical protein
MCISYPFAFFFLDFASRAGVVCTCLWVEFWFLVGLGLKPEGHGQLNLRISTISSLFILSLCFLDHTMDSIVRESFVFKWSFFSVSLEFLRKSNLGRSPLMY